MDGIQILQVIDRTFSTDYSLVDDEVPEEEIQRMIEVNEGISPTGPDFKHLVKLTPNLTHRSLKKRKARPKSLCELDDDDVATGDLTESPQDGKMSDKPRSRVEKLQLVVASLREEISQLKMQRRKVKEELDAETKMLSKVKVEVKKKLLLLDKIDQGLKKRGRRLGGKELREDLGISPASEVTETIASVKRGRGRPRKSSNETENKPKASSPPGSPVPVTPQKLPKTTPLKEKDLNSGNTMQLCITKLEDDPVEKVDKEAVRPMSPIRRSSRQIRCTEKLAALIETSPKLSDSSAVVRKILNEGDLPDEKSPIEKKVKKRKTDPVFQNEIPLLKKLKLDNPPAAGREVRAGSIASDTTSCRSFKQAKQAMMKGVPSIRICEECSDGAIKPLKCVKCFSFLHPKCAGDESDEINSDWICPACTANKNTCFVCKSDQGTRQMCLTAGCGKFYHHDCLKLFPQTKFNHGTRKNVGLLRDPDDSGPAPLEILTCSLHTCHTCSSDNPMQATFVNPDKLLKCVKCPTAYHCMPGVCLPAGTEILSTSDIICGKHTDSNVPSKTISHVNITWCFVCTKGGSLTYCALCPSAIHPECLKIKPPDGKYYCEECESGRFPLHGEIVWVKLGSYRWWPSKVLYPDEVPMKLKNTKHRRSEFAVMFFGTKDHQWISRGRTFLYNEGDTQKNLRIQKRLDRNFQIAMEEASVAFQQRQEVIAAHSMTKKERPEYFAAIRSNRYDSKLVKKSETEVHVCNCRREDDEPCGPSSNCLNRGLLIECSPDNCPARSKCLNQRFAKRQYPDLTIFKTINRGWGVSCNEDLQQGQFVIEYVGLVIDEAELERRLKIKEESKNQNYYLMRLDSNHVIDAEPCGNNSRFINHSCRPNCETQKWTVNGFIKIGIFASKFIPKGEELTFNYDWVIRGVRSNCYCGADGCSGVIGEVPKTVKVEKKKKTKPKTTDSKCYMCQKAGNELMTCSKCPRVIHTDCANLTTKPDDWVCPKHCCGVCGKPTKQHCQECKEAYCNSHTKGNLFFNKKGELFCAKHDVDKTLNNARKSIYLSLKEKKRGDDSSSTTSSNTESLDWQCSLV